MIKNCIAEFNYFKGVGKMNFKGLLSGFLAVILVFSFATVHVSASAEQVITQETTHETQQVSTQNNQNTSELKVRE